MTQMLLAGPQMTQMLLAGPQMAQMLLVAPQMAQMLLGRAQMAQMLWGGPQISPIAQMSQSGFCEEPVTHKALIAKATSEPAAGHRPAVE